MLRKARSAICWLLSPCVISAMISDSRVVSPCVRPGQSPLSGAGSTASSVTTCSPACTRSSASTSSPADSRFAR